MLIFGQKSCFLGPTFEKIPFSNLWTNVAVSTSSRWAEIILCRCVMEKTKYLVILKIWSTILYFHIISRLLKWKVFWRIMWKCWLNVKANWMTWKHKPRIWKKAQWSKIKNSIWKLLGNMYIPSFNFGVHCLVHFYVHLYVYLHVQIVLDGSDLIWTDTNQAKSDFYGLICTSPKQ